MCPRTPSLAKPTGLTSTPAPRRFAGMARSQPRSARPRVPGWQDRRFRRWPVREQALPRCLHHRTCGLCPRHRLPVRGPRLWQPSRRRRRPGRSFRPRRPTQGALPRRVAGQSASRGQKRSGSAMTRQCMANRTATSTPNSPMCAFAIAKTMPPSVVFLWTSAAFRVRAAFGDMRPAAAGLLGLLGTKALRRGTPRL